MAKTEIQKANAAYESWLREQLPGEVVDKDLDAKHEKMSEGPFTFLRATYWRWAETILAICPELSEAPQVLAVGDIHLENYGTWRDHDGRLIWGINDFDEAAVMPYPLDLVRLATSARLAQIEADDHSVDVCSTILAGYRKGLEAACPFVMDETNDWLRERLDVRDKKRRKFWDEIKEAKASKPPEFYRLAIAATMPEAGIVIKKYYPNQAGTGSLGRPRWVGVADWHGGQVVREAKALVPSGWIRANNKKPSQHLHVQEISRGRYRAPDPWYSANDKLAVRRLSPNNRKINVDKEPEMLLDLPMLEAMGHELANIHLGTGEHRAAVENDLAGRKKGWLTHATEAAVKSVNDEFKDWSR
jgi:uncharacterized protein (DUF2252 family)